MWIGEIARSERDASVEWSARVTSGAGEATVRFSAPSAVASPDGDASHYLVAMLLPAMAMGEDLTVDGPVSGRCLRGARRAAVYYAQMNRRLRVPALEVAGAADPRPAAPGVGCYLSRGVDSPFSIAVPRDHDPGAVTHLLHCRTLISSQDDATRAGEVERCGALAAEVGLPMHVLTTDLRGVADTVVGWSDMQGSGLAALALTCGGALGHVVVPSAYSAAIQPPAGSHPLIDPLFSTESVQVVHDHLERGRQGRIDWLVEHRPELLAHLKVCWAQSRNDNCGRCRKCLLTMAELAANGSLHLASEFPDRIDLQAVRALRMSHVTVRRLWVETALRLAETGADPSLHRAIADMLRASANPAPREALASWRARRRGRDAFDPERTWAHEYFLGDFSDEVLGVVRSGALPDLHPVKPWEVTVRPSVGALLRALVAGTRRT